MEYVLAALGGWLAGSIPSGYWVVRFVRRIDIRRVGSKSIGATNVWRVLGWRYGIPVIVLDVAKGFAPALVARLLVDDLAGVLAGGAAMAGHWRPLFMGFAKGGKTVATAGGIFFGLAPWVGLIASAIWIVLFVATRYASVASMLSALSLPVLSALFGEPWPVDAFAVVAAAAILLLHRPNIRRLLSGTENRFHLRRNEALG